MSVLALVGAAHFTVAHFGSPGMPITPPRSPPVHRTGWEVSVMLGWQRARVSPCRAQERAHTIKSKPENRERKIRKVDVKQKEKEASFSREEKQWLA